MRVLVVSLFYPPYNSAGAVRLGKTTEQLIARGHQVRIVTASPQPLPPNLATTVPECFVHRTPWLAPPWSQQRPESGARALASPVAGSSGVVRAKSYESLRWVFRNAIYLPDKYVGWFPFAVPAIKADIKRESFDVALASAGPATSLLACHVALRHSHVPWVAEFRDLWAGNHFSTRAPWQSHLDMRLEKAVVQSAAAIVTVNGTLALTLARRHRKRVTVVANGYDETWRDMGCSIQPPPKRGDRRLRILFSGTFFPGRHDFAPFFRGLAMLGPKAHEFDVRFVGPDTHLIAAEAADYGLTGAVSTAPTTSRDCILAMQVSSDVLLLPTSREATSQDVLPAKLYEYAAAGVPILAVTPERTAIAKAVRDFGFGLATRDHRHIGVWLNDLLVTQAHAPGIPPRRDPPPELSRAAQVDILESLLLEVASTDRISPGLRAT